MTTVAGSSSSYSYSGDGGQATSAMLNNPTGVAFDTSSGYVYIADNVRVREAATSRESGH